MKHYFSSVLLSMAFFLVDAAPSPDHLKSKRSFHSYFENYFDEMATSACVARGNSGGLYFAVRRKCEVGQTCHQICTLTTIRKQSQIWDKNKLLNTRCVDSFHIYKHRPSLADNKLADTDTLKVGMTVYRYNSCNVGVCGPNYCCCTGTQ